MKKSFEEKAALCDIKKRAGFREAINKRFEKLKHGPVKCPLCSEPFQGIKEMWVHFKDHCR